jgi:hypothetical protein
MSNALYDNARETFLKGGINWNTDTINVALMWSGAPTDTTSNKYWNDIGGSGGSNTAAGPIPLTNKTATGGAADADDVTFQSVAVNASSSTTQITAIVIYKDDGSSGATAPLIARIDTATGLPITPNGGDIIVTWDNGANKIFKL